MSQLRCQSLKKCSFFLLLSAVVSVSDGCNPSAAPLAPGFSSPPAFFLQSVLPVIPLEVPLHCSSVQTFSINLFPSPPPLITGLYWEIFPYSSQHHYLLFFFWNMTSWVNSLAGGAGEKVTSCCGGQSRKLAIRLAAWISENMHLIGPRAAVKNTLVTCGWRQ